MIPFDMTYYRPATIEEAVTAWSEAADAGLKPVYYGGGTEIITLARVGELSPGAVIDIKTIPECRELTERDGHLVQGAALPLTQINEANHYPLQTEVLMEIADQTVRNKLTLGGNLSGKIIFRESSLPLLLAAAMVSLAGPEGRRTVPLREHFDGSVQYREGEFLVQVLIPAAAAAWPFYTAKVRKQGKVGYPLVTIAAVRQDDAIRAAFSGVCAAPFRSAAVEDALNEPTGRRKRAQSAARQLPDDIVDNKDGSAAYRQYILEKVIEDALMALEGGRGHETIS